MTTRRKKLVEAVNIEDFELPKNRDGVYVIKGGVDRELHESDEFSITYTGYPLKLSSRFDKGNDINALFSLFNADKELRENISSEIVNFYLTKYFRRKIVLFPFSAYVYDKNGRKFTWHEVSKKLIYTESAYVITSHKSPTKTTTEEMIQQVIKFQAEYAGRFPVSLNEVQIRQLYRAYGKNIIKTVNNFCRLIHEGPTYPMWQNTHKAFISAIKAGRLDKIINLLVLVDS